jgi:transketolase N-terminal domain/subunit
MTTDIAELEKSALELRRLALKIIFQAGSGHPGGSLSATDLMTALFFGGILRYDSSNPKDPKRDRFLLSKGHASGIHYSVLAKAGFIEVSDLDDYRKINSKRFLSGHGHPKTPGIEIASGSLGQGLSVAHGIALGTRLQGFDSKTYVILGDGELQEGQIWEAAMSASHFKLENLTVILDNNNLQQTGKNIEILILLFPIMIYAYYMSKYKFNNDYLYLFILMSISSVFSALNNSLEIILKSFNKYFLAALIPFIVNILGRLLALILFCLISK